MNERKKTFDSIFNIKYSFIFYNRIVFLKFDVYQIIISRFDNEEITVTDKKFASQDSLALSEIYRGRESLYQALPIDGDDIVMIGDSITQRGEWIELTQNTNVKNRGIDSDSVAGVINRIHTITQGQPQAVFINIGINDLFRGYDIESVLVDYKRLIDEIKTSSQNTEIYIESLLPVNNTDYDHPINNEDVQSFNIELKKIANESDVTFIDTYTHFANENNELYKNYTEDGIHLSGEGFLNLKDILSQYMELSY